MSNGLPLDPSRHAAELEQLCRSCCDFVARAVGLDLDYTSDTLSLLDHYATLARSDIDAKPELLPLLAKVTGGYFGEVLVRGLGMFWKMPTADAHDWLVCSRVSFCAINPVGVAYGALVGVLDHPGPTSELAIAPEDREFVAGRLESLPPVRTEDFLLFSTRYDVFEIASEALAAQMQANGQGDVAFETDDYDEM